MIFGKFGIVSCDSHVAACSVTPETELDEVSFKAAQHACEVQLGSRHDAHATYRSCDSC